MGISTLALKHNPHRNKMLKRKAQDGGNDECTHDSQGCSENHEINELEEKQGSRKKIKTELQVS